MYCSKRGDEDVRVDIVLINWKSNENLILIIKTSVVSSMLFVSSSIS